MDRNIISYTHTNETHDANGVSRSNIVDAILVRYSLTEGEVTVTQDYVHSLNTGAVHHKSDYVELADITEGDLLSWIDANADGRFNSFERNLQKTLDNQTAEPEKLVTL